MGTLFIVNIRGKPLAYNVHIALRTTTMPKPPEKINLKMPTVKEDQLIKAAAETEDRS